MAKAKCDAVQRVAGVKTKAPITKPEALNVQHRWDEIRSAKSASHALEVANRAGLWTAAQRNKLQTYIRGRWPGLDVKWKPNGKARIGSSKKTYTRYKFELVGFENPFQRGPQAGAMGQDAQLLNMQKRRGADERSVPETLLKPKGPSSSWSQAERIFYGKLNSNQRYAKLAKWTAAQFNKAKNAAQVVEIYNRYLGEMERGEATTPRALELWRRAAELALERKNADDIFYNAIEEIDEKTLSQQNWYDEEMMAGDRAKYPAEPAEPAGQGRSVEKRAADLRAKAEELLGRKAASRIGSQEELELLVTEYETIEEAEAALDKAMLVPNVTPLPMWKEPGADSLARIRSLRQAGGGTVEIMVESGYGRKWQPKRVGQVLNTPAGKVEIVAARYEWSTKRHGTLTKSGKISQKGQGYVIYTVKPAEGDVATRKFYPDGEGFGYVITPASSGANPQLTEKGPDKIRRLLSLVRFDPTAEPRAMDFSAAEQVIAEIREYNFGLSKRLVITGIRSGPNKGKAFIQDTGSKVRIWKVKDNQFEGPMAQGRFVTNEKLNLEKWDQGKVDAIRGLINDAQTFDELMENYHAAAPLANEMGLSSRLVRMAIAKADRLGYTTEGLVRHLSYIDRIKASELGLKRKAPGFRTLFDDGTEMSFLSFLPEKRGAWYENQSWESETLDFNGRHNRELALAATLRASDMLRSNGDFLLLESPGHLGFVAMADGVFELFQLDGKLYSALLQSEFDPIDGARTAGRMVVPSHVVEAMAINADRATGKVDPQPIPTIRIVDTNQAVRAAYSAEDSSYRPSQDADPIPGAMGSPSPYTEEEVRGKQHGDRSKDWVRQEAEKFPRPNGPQGAYHGRRRTVEGGRLNVVEAGRAAPAPRFIAEDVGPVVAEIAKDSLAYNTVEAIMRHLAVLEAQGYAIHPDDYRALQSWADVKNASAPGGARTRTQMQAREGADYMEDYDAGLEDSSLEDQMDGLLETSEEYQGLMEEILSEEFSGLDGNEDSVIEVDCDG